MRKLMLSIIIILLTFSVHSQSLPDSTKIPNSHLRIALKLVAQGRQCEQELLLVRHQTDVLYDKLSVKDSIIYQYKVAMQMQDKVIEDYVSSEANLIQQRTNLEKAVKDLNKKMKRQKTKMFITSLAGVIGMGAAAILLLK